EARRLHRLTSSVLGGVIPADAFGAGKPDALIADAMLPPQPIDPWIHDGAVYRWSFDEGAGSVVSNSAVGDPAALSTDGLLSGAAFATDPDRRTSFLAFDRGLDGSAVDSVDIEHDIQIDGSALSLSAWFRAGGLAPAIDDAPEEVCRILAGNVQPCVLVAKAKTGEDWSLWMANVQLSTEPEAPANWRFYFNLKTDAGSVSADTDSANLELADWHHLAATYDGAEMKVYVNGVTKPADWAYQSGDLVISSNPVEIGAREHWAVGNSTSINGFYGLIDDVRIWNRALLDHEVLELISSTP
ncbi:MAG: LamG domain-containing protein, partial [Acidobacteriota bacterium]